MICRSSEIRKAPKLGINDAFFTRSRAVQFLGNLNFIYQIGISSQCISFVMTIHNKLWFLILGSQLITLTSRRPAEKMELLRLRDTREVFNLELIDETKMRDRIKGNVGLF